MCAIAKYTCMRVINSTRNRSTYHLNHFFFLIAKLLLPEVLISGKSLIYDCIIANVCAYSINFQESNFKEKRMLMYVYVWMQRETGSHHSPRLHHLPEIIHVHDIDDIVGDKTRRGTSALKSLICKMRISFFWYFMSLDFESEIARGFATCNFANLITSSYQI